MIVKHTTLGIVVALMAALPLPAFAHVTLETSTAAVGGSYKAILRIPHGCDGAATNVVRVQVPEGFFSVKPMPHAGWDLKTVTGTYANTYLNHGVEVSEGVTEIIWSGGDLPDEWYDEFIFRGTFSPTLAANEPFYFPVVQECGDAVEEWLNVSGDDANGAPAPKVTLVAAEGGHEHHMAAAGDEKPMAAGAPVAHGDLTLSGGFARAMVPTAKSGGAFLTITNTGKEADRLIGVASPRAGRGEVHEMKMDGSVMQMRRLENGIEIPAGESVELTPGGIHVMLFDIAKPFSEGEVLPLILTFEKAGDVELMVNVGGLAAKGPMTH